MTPYVLVSCSNPSKAPPYVEALRAGGFAPEEIRLAPASETSPEEAVHLAQGAAWVLLCGGPDLHPRYYGEEAHPNANLSIMPERDANELALLPAARERRVPVFGVCRGLQTLNVFFGGTLFQDLRLMWPGSLLHDLSYPRDALIHRVRVTDTGCPIGQILEQEVGLVNSRHHQAIKDLGDDLQPVACAPDGIVEAVCAVDGDWWVWGVQWHPENLIGLDSQRALWQCFRRAVVARRPRPQPVTT